MLDLASSTRRLYASRQFAESVALEGSLVCNAMQHQAYVSQLPATHGFLEGGLSQTISQNPILQQQILQQQVLLLQSQVAGDMLGMGRAGCAAPVTTTGRIPPDT